MAGRETAPLFLRVKYPRMNNPKRLSIARLLPALLFLMAGTSHAVAPQEVRVSPEGSGLAEALMTVAEGGVIRVAPGEYRGNVVIDRPLTLIGEPGAVLDGRDEGSVLKILAPDVTVRGFTIRNSGYNLTLHDSGIHIERGAHRANIESNRLENVAFGIWAWHMEDLTVSGNEITGNPEVRSQDRGDAIRLYAITGGLIKDNRIRGARDAVYVEICTDLTIRGNHFEELRYGVHYMYAHNGRVIGNSSRRTRSGYALMSSRNLEVTGNRSEDDLNYGILLNTVTGSTITGNTVRGVYGWSGGTGSDAHGVVLGGEGKALFVYNSQHNEISGNVLADSEIGIHLTAGSEDNRIRENAFLRNQTQVKYVATRHQEWSRDGRGNHWSDYLGWDLDGDGIGDLPHEPNDGVDRLLWKYPLAKFLMNSPAITTLRWVQREFPILRPSGVRDSAPLMTPPGTEQTFS